MTTETIQLPGLTEKLTDNTGDALEITELLEDVITNENDDAIFECKIECQSPPKCSWYKDGRLIKHTRRTRISNNRKWHRLEITSVNFKDQGVYTIVCTDGCDCVSSKATLHVAPTDCNLDRVLYTNAAPKRNLVVTRHLSDVKIEVGGRVELEVHVQTEVDLQYIWFKNNKIVTQNERIIQLDSKKTSLLSIHNAEISDSGIYYVVIKSKLGMASSVTDVQVLEETMKCPDCESIPNIQEHLADELEVNETEEIRLICQAAFDMDTTIQWFKNKIALDCSKFVPEDYGNHYIGLRILSPSRSDSGDYSVMLKDEKTGHVDSTNCYLTVNPLPMVSLPSVPLKRPLESVVACCGSKVLFHCSFPLEDPKYFYVVWYIAHFRVERTNSRFIVGCEGGNFILYIQKLEPAMSGEVVCELRRSLPNQKSVLINSTAANMTVVPQVVVEEERDNTMYKNGKVYRDCAEGVRIDGQEINEYKSQNGANGHRLNQFQANEIILEIIYCRLEDDWTCYLQAVRGDTGVLTTHLGVHEKKKETDVDNQKSIVVEWVDSILPTTAWYIIEVGLKTGNYVQAGVSSVSWFEVKEPRVGQMIRFRIRTLLPLTWSDSFVCIEPSPGEAEKPVKNHELKPMDQFEPNYTKTGDLIGCGAFGSVVLVRDKTGQHFAAKILKTRTQKKRDTALREFEIMRNLRHPKLVELSDAFVAKDYFVLVMDYLWGGELFDRIVEEEHIKEVDVVPYVRQICEALQYLHEHKIAHLDLKPENIICLSPNSGQVKIIDFGLARVLEEGHVTRAIYGTRDYVAPEVLNFESLTLACDMWSLGVVTYMLLSGVMPFAGETWPERSANIIMANYNYDDTAFSEISDPAKDFVDQLLVLSADHRLSASKALSHKWIVEGPPKGTKAGYMKRARENLKSYLANYRARWQRAGNVMIAALRLRTHARAPAANCVT